MQTFLPYPDFRESARVLDPKRLGNQFYREGMTLFRGKWKNHPASKMWRNHRYYLGLYLLALHEELEARGYSYPHHVAEVIAGMSSEPLEAHNPPSWLGNPAFHASHRSNLLRKDPDWYAKFGWKESAELEYVWPDP